MSCMMLTSLFVAATQPSCASGSRSHTIMLAPCRTCHACTHRLFGGGLKLKSSYTKPGRYFAGKICSASGKQEPMVCTSAYKSITFLEYAQLISTVHSQHAAALALTAFSKGALLGSLRSVGTVTFSVASADTPSPQETHACAEALDSHSALYDVSGHSAVSPSLLL